MQYCDGADWIGFSKSGALADPCADSPSPGTACSSGTVYAGLNAASQMVFTTAADAGSFSNQAGLLHCDGLNANGQSDWVLPNRDDLRTLYTNRAAVGGFATGFYWSSEQQAFDYYWHKHFDALGSESSSDETYAYQVRCTRTESAALSCGNPASSAGDLTFNSTHRVLQWCDGATWHAAGPVDPTGPMAGCTGPDGLAGDVIYNGSYGVLQYCDGDAWQAVGKVGPFNPCYSGPPGVACNDGSIYAGATPDGGVLLFTTPADAGSYTWDDGGFDYIDTTMENCFSPDFAGSSCVTGEANTTLLAGLVNAASPYMAATYCNNLSAHGHTDWYLPARNELTVLYNNRTAIGGFNTTGQYYWSSSESSNASGRARRFSDGFELALSKFSAYLVRCVRR